MKTRLLACFLMLLLAGITKAQTPTNTDILGMHDLSAGTTPIHGGLPACLFCHAPHSSNTGAKALWSSKLSTVTNYTLPQGTFNPVEQPRLGSDSNLCLSCHDGTVALGQTTPYGNIQMYGAWNPQDQFLQGDLTGVHPFNFTLPLKQETQNLWPEVIAGTGTRNPAVKLIDRNVQCTSCHEPHNQFIDPVAQQFLVTSNQDSALCLACHQSAPTPSSATVKAPTTMMAAGSMTRAAQSGPTMQDANASSKPSHDNGLASWSGSIHAVASHKVSKGARLGPYGNTARNGCLSCHASHNAPGGKDLLTGPVTSVPNMDPTTQNCITCHNGGSVVEPAIPSVFAEINKGGHPFPQASNKHVSNEEAVLDNNRHATCVDCHNPHTSRATDSFSTPLRGSQNGVSGVSATDGTTVLRNASNQYETCLRCHGSSAGKQSLAKLGYLPVWAVSAADPLNIIPQFSQTATSSHPVMRDRNSALPQPSLLDYMWNLNGTAQGRVMGTRIFCTDCHNSDDNREFGGTGPSGPHGSQYPHILERRYEMSQVAPLPGGGPGSTIQNLFPQPVLDPGCSSYPCASPYALCAKCHDLKKVAANTSFSQHARHINDGFSCSTCHTSHGIGATSASLSGERLVNFDVNVVAGNDGAPISFNRAKNTCSLTCHNSRHNSDGTVLSSPVRRSTLAARKP